MKSSIVSNKLENDVNLASIEPTTVAMFGFFLFLLLNDI